MERESSELSESPPEHWSISYSLTVFEIYAPKVVGLSGLVILALLKKVQKGRTPPRAPEAFLGVCS